MKHHLPASNTIAIAVASAALGICTSAVADSNDLEQRVERLEQQLADQGGDMSSALLWSGVVEVEGFSAEDYNGDSASGFELATVELGVEAQVNDYVSSSVLLLY